jgi:UDP-glucose 4-epimerase
VRVLVTGGAGFIGSAVCRGLLARDADVRVLDNLATGCRENLAGLDVDLQVGSILDIGDVTRAMRHIDSVIHLAARPSVPRSIADPMATHEANATGTLRVLTAARDAGAYLCLSSSSSVYGANPALPKREDMLCLPKSPYAVSKLAAESYCLAFAECYGMRTLPFRFFNVYGPRQSAGHDYAAVIPAFVTAALAGEPLQIHGDGRQTRDFTNVDTVRDVLVRAALDQVVSRQPVNLAFGTRTSLLSVIDLLEDILGHPVRRRHNDPRPGDVRDSQADNSALRALFPDVRPTPLESGLAQTVGWLHANITRGQALAAPA